MANVKTYTGAAFRTHYVQAGLPADTLLKPDFSRFFIVPVEEMSRLMRLPVPPTRLTNHILTYLTAGEAVMSVGSETYRIGPNEGLIVPAGQVFSFDKIDVNRGFICSFHPDFVIEQFGRAELRNDFAFLRLASAPRFRFDDPTADFVAHVFDRIRLTYSEHGLARADLIGAYLLALLYEISRVHQPTPAGPQTQAVRITNQFRELLLASRPTYRFVTDYARRLNITPNHLNKCVRAVTGKSPTKWIDEAIVLEAKVLLHQTTLSISEVAAEVGLADASYFGRLFRKYTGTTPLAFRRLMKTS